MKIGISAKYITLVIVFIIAGCGAISAKWILNLDTPYRFTYTYTGSDQQSVFHYQANEEGAALLTHYDTDGNVLSTMNIPEMDFPRSYPHPLIELSSNAFYLGERSPQRIAYVDPDTHHHWVGIENPFISSDDSLSISRTFATQHDELAFSGRVTRDNNGDSMTNDVIGIINNEGLVTTFHKFENIDDLSFQQSTIDRDFLLVTHTSDADSGNTHTQLTSYDASLNVTHQTALPFDLTFVRLIGDTLLARLRTGDIFQYNVYDRRGNLRHEDVRNSFSSFYKPIAGDSSFYYIQTYRPQRYAEFSHTIICNYNYDYEEQWCINDSLKGGYLYVEKAAVNDQDELTLTLRAETDAIFTGLSTAITQLDSGSIFADVDLFGEKRYAVTHQVIAPNSQYRFQAKEQPYYHRGKMRLCGFLDICTSPATTLRPGVCDSKDSTYLSDYRVFSSNTFCANDITRESFPQLSFWE